MLPNSQNGRAAPPCHVVAEIQQITNWDSWSWGFLLVANGWWKYYNQI